MCTPIIQELYHTFSTYKLGKTITGCHCNVCLEKDYCDYLINTPLKEINSFTMYLTSAGILENDENDFRYFLPRILETFYNSPYDHEHFHYDFWILLGQSKHQFWPRREQEILGKFADELIKHVERTSPDDVELIIEDLKDARLLTNEGKNTYS